MPRIDIDKAPTGHGTSYPDEFAGPCLARRRWRLGDAAGLDQFGVNLLRLPAGAWSSQRHWHETEDEFVWVVSGEVVLVEGNGETVLTAGDCAGLEGGRSERPQDREPVGCGGRSAGGRNAHAGRRRGGLSRYRHGPAQGGRPLFPSRRKPVSQA